jgi:beta-phosphoglucomutase
MIESTKRQDWGVIFDMDGVLIDSYRAHLEAFRRMLANYDLKMSAQQFENTFGRTNPDIFALLFPHVNPEHYDHMGAEKEAAFRELLAEDFPEMAGAGALVSALHDAGARMAIGTSGPPENVQAVLRKLPGGSHIRETVTARDIMRGKPDPEVFLAAADKIGLSPDACAVVEDAPAGVQAGKSAGCAVIGLTGTVTRRHLAKADLVADSLYDLTPATILDLIRANKASSP